ncbi:Ger(x)C family germination protein [Clostridium moniliforme]|uniref:Ger(X)C family germination protein n=1 Tax=Clostridium moniliforme TaxID=39489 RepID=A0ABS4EYW7_9CLOT|nr:Ger(x)C family spore germination protein [Clostridium moniliforme]MBP1889189.1 Ger(x)C family germination protein [Clostridium moniliforme]
MKRNGKKIFKLFLVFVLIASTLSGCFNYNEINTVTFTTSTIFDIDDLGRVVIYLDCVKPYRNTNESSDNGKRIIYKGVGKTALEAIRDINVAASYKINFSQNRAIIFTEAAARQGINKYLNLINNDQEFKVKPYMFVYFGDIENLINISAKDEENTGIFLSELVQKNKANARLTITNINDYLVKSEIGNNYALISGLELRKDIIDERIEVSGAALMRNNFMVERISIQDGLSYNFLTDNIKTGTLEVQNPQMNTGFITLEILSNKTKTDIEYDGNNVILTKKIKLKTTIAEAQGRFISSKAAIEMLKEEAEDNIKSYLTTFFYKFSSKNIDILQVERLLEIKYPNLVIKNPISKTNLKIEIDLELDGSEKVKNSFF